MPSSLDQFETIARSLAALPEKDPITQPPADVQSLHSFDTRNIHPGLPLKVRKLFDDGHYAEATFHAFKYLDKQVQKHSVLSESGYKLMMAAFDDAKPKLQLTPLGNESERDERKDSVGACESFECNPTGLGFPAPLGQSSLTGTCRDKALRW